MSQQKYPKAYEAYQQAVYRDGKNPTFWCSIGVLYYQINQYRDALDAYSRAIRLNPYISEVWYDLGTLVSPPVVFTIYFLHSGLLTRSSMSRATTRLPMHWTLINGQQSWIRATHTLKLAFSFFAPAVQMAVRHLLLLSLPTCILQRIRQVLQVLLNGEDPRSNNPLVPLLPLRQLVRAGLAGCPTSTRHPNRPTLMRAEPASLSVVQRRLSGSQALLRKSRLHASHTLSLTDLAHRVVARHRLPKPINMPSLFLRHHLSLNPRLPHRLLRDVLSILTGMARRLRRLLLPITLTMPTRLRMQWLRSGRPTALALPMAALQFTTTACHPPSRLIPSTKLPRHLTMPPTIQKCHPRVLPKTTHSRRLPRLRRSLSLLLNAWRTGLRL